MSIDPLSTLTNREREVLLAMVEGKCASTIATEQFVSVTTVRSQIREVLFKLRVNSQLAAVAYVHSRIPEHPEWVRDLLMTTTTTDRKVMV